MDEKMYKEIIERLDRLEEKLDEILLRLPYYCYPQVNLDDQDRWPADTTEYHPGITVIKYGNRSDS